MQETDPGKEGRLPQPAFAAAEDEPGSPVSSLQGGLPDGRTLRLLVAEDNPDNQRVIRRMLESAGACVDVAADGQTAVDLAARTRYDLILMDLQMPVLDGSQAATAMRAHERLADEEPVPILAFTAHAVEESRQRCLDAGMNEYLVKPIAPRHLVQAISRWIDRRPVVLVADDAPQIRQLVKRCLRDRYRVVQASNGREALDQFGRQQVSLVLLDMDMPIMDGRATAAAIRRRDDGRSVPIVALTGDDAEGARERTMASGCTIHVSKPVNLATLSSTVESAMRKAGTVATDLAARIDSTPVPLDIDPIVADLVPVYVRDKRRQLLDIRRFIADGEMDRVRRIGHDLKGTGAAYGIPDVTRLGRALEAAGQDTDPFRATLLVDELDTLLQRLEQQLGGMT